MHIHIHIYICNPFFFSFFYNQIQVTLVIEQPNHPVATAYVRLALMTEKSIEMDLPLAPDVIDICQQEFNRMKQNPDLKPNQNILKSLK